MIKLVVAYTVEFHRFLRRQHEIKRRPGRSPVREGGLHAPWSNFMLTHKGDADVTAGRVWREVKKFAHIFECHVIDHGRGSSGNSNGCDRLGGSHAPAQHRCRTHRYTLHEVAT